MYYWGFFEGPQLYMLSGPMAPFQLKTNSHYSKGCMTQNGFVASLFTILADNLSCMPMLFFLQDNTYLKKQIRHPKRLRHMLAIILCKK